MRKRPPINRLVAEIPKRKTVHPPDSPKQCPCGHKHISWTVDDDDVFCWDCNKKYPFPECFGSSGSASSVRTNMEQLPLFQGEGKLEEDRDKAYSTERRQHPRAEVTCPVVIEKSLGVFMSGKTRDISEGGAFIACWEPLQPNEDFQIEFGGAHLDRNMKATAEVIWSDISGFNDEIGSRGMGIRFTEISDDVKSVISNLVSNCLSPDVS